MAQTNITVPACITHDCMRCKHDPRNHGTCREARIGYYFAPTGYCQRGSQFVLYRNAMVVHSDSDEVDKPKRR